MCKEVHRQCGARPSPPPKGYKKKNHKACGGGNYGYGRAPVLREPWRTSPKARHTLSSAGMEELKMYLEEEICVVPQQGSPELPVLEVSPAELIRHILARQSALTGSNKPGAGMFVEVYGGVAQAVVSVDKGIEDWTPPTDFDARFYIPRTGNDSWDFDRCRFFVEEYLLMKLQLAAPPDSELRHASPGVVRHRYYQKQVMIGGAFSLLSVGDPSTGKAIDLEFATGSDGARKYFDDANSFVIPLSLQQLAGMAPAAAMSMTGSFEHAIELTRRRELLVREPGQVVNGLALYAHAVTTKQLTAASRAAEDACALQLAQAFAEGAAALQARFDDPLRFLRSFLRSHYTARPLHALATVAQLCAELAAYAEEMQPLEEAAAPREGQFSTERLLGQLLGDVLLAAVDDAAGDPEAMMAVLRIAAFARSPGGAAGEDAEGEGEEDGETAAGRELMVGAWDGRGVRLLRKGRRCEGARETAETAAEHLERAAGEGGAGWCRAVVAAAAAVLRGEGEDDEEAVALRLGRELEAEGESEAAGALEAVCMHGDTSAESGADTDEAASSAEDEEEVEDADPGTKRHGLAEAQEAAVRSGEGGGWVGGQERCRREEGKGTRREDDDDQQAPQLPQRAGGSEGITRTAPRKALEGCSCRAEIGRIGLAAATEQADPLHARPEVAAELWPMPRLVRVQAG